MPPSLFKNLFTGLQAPTGDRTGFLSRLRKARQTGQAGAATSAPLSTTVNQIPAPTGPQTKASPGDLKAISAPPPIAPPPPITTPVPQPLAVAPTAPAQPATAAPAAPTPPQAAPTAPVPAPVAPAAAPVAPAVPPQIEALRSQITAGFTPSAQETQLQQQLNQILTGAETGVEAIRTQPIPTPFLRGQAAGLERQAGLAAVPLQRQLALLQQQRQAQQEGALVQLGFEREDVQALQEGRAQREEQQQDVTSQIQSIASDLVSAGASQEQANQVLQSQTVEQALAASAETGLLAPGEDKAPDFTLGAGQVRFDAQGEIIAKGPPKPVSAVAEAKAIERTEKDAAARDTQISTISLINSLLGSPDLATVSGKSRFGIPARLAGTANVKGQLSQLKALTSLEGRNQLKGTGTISDFEAQMLSNAANALNFAIGDDGRVAMSDVAVEQNLKNIRGVLLSKAGEPVTIIATDPAGVLPSETFENVTRADIQNAALNGLIIDYQ